MFHSLLPQSPQSNPDVPRAFAGARWLAVVLVFVLLYMYMEIFAPSFCSAFSWAVGYIPRELSRRRQAGQVLLGGTADGIALTGVL